MYSNHIQSSNKQQCNASESLKHQYQILKILGYFSLPNSFKIQNYIKYSLAVFLASSPAKKKQKSKTLTAQ